MPQLFAIALLTLLSLPSLALGVGEPQLLSALGQPLQVRIPLLESGDMTTEEIKVHRASADAFERMGVDNSIFISGLTLTIKQEGKGLVVWMTSSDPIKEPYIDLVLALRWPQGTLHKQVTLLLDPPYSR